MPAVPLAERALPRSSGNGHRCSPSPPRPPGAWRTSSPGSLAVASASRSSCCWSRAAGSWSSALVAVICGDPFFDDAAGLLVGGRRRAVGRDGPRLLLPRAGDRDDERRRTDLLGRRRAAGDRRDRDRQPALGDHRARGWWRSSSASCSPRARSTTTPRRPRPGGRRSAWRCWRRRLRRLLRADRRAGRRLGALDARGLARGGGAVRARWSSCGRGRPSRRRGSGSASRRSGASTCWRRAARRPPRPRATSASSRCSAGCTRSRPCCWPRRCCTSACARRSSSGSCARWAGWGRWQRGMTHGRVAAATFTFAPLQLAPAAISAALYARRVRTLSGTPRAVPGLRQCVVLQRRRADRRGARLAAGDAPARSCSGRTWSSTC